MKTGREILLFSLLSLCLAALIGCGKKADKDKPPDRLMIEPLVGIGAVRFGMSKDEVIKHFGWPDKTYSAEETKLNYVASKGLSFTIDSELGLQEVACWSDNWPTTLPFAVTTFTGRTKEGIAMGATREQIVAAYGQPNRQDSKGDFENLHYDKLRTKFTLVRGKLAAMILEAPK